jgi:hypothetical protein
MDRFDEQLKNGTSGFCPVGDVDIKVLGAETR